MYDTVKGSDYIGDQDAIEYMCQNGPEAIIELEHMGLPFSRQDDGRIYQRPFGGQSLNFGGAQAARTAAAADRTGHALLHTLYQQNLKNNTTIFSEWYALDLVKNQDGVFVGCTAISIETGEIVYFKARATILATGGQDEFINQQRMRILIQAMVLVWRCVLGSPCKIWKCGNFIPQALQELAF